MRKVIVAVCLAVLTAGTATAGTRTLTATVAAGDIDRLLLDSGVGDVELRAVEGDSIDVEVVLEPRRGGLFSSMKRAEREVANARLEPEVRDGAVRLRVRSDSDDRRFEESWTVLMPARIAAVLDVGVGDVTIEGLSGGVRLDTGVGEVRVAVPGGDLEIDIGVGDVEVESFEASYGTVRCSGGVGDARLRLAGRTVSDEGFVGSSADWDGTGPGRIEIDAGVGDIQIRLE